VTAGSGDRRKGDRRAKNPRPTSRGSAPSASTAIAIPTARVLLRPRLAGGRRDTPDSRFLTREARRVATAQDTALARVYRTYAAARAVVGLVLVAAQACRQPAGRAPVLASALLCIAYAVQAITFWLLPRFHR
jgi:two-component system sensor histidine kinase PilS (NtrC family)